MSTYIRVDHSQLDRAADTIEEKIRSHDSHMGQIATEVDNLEGSFSGDDYIAYKNQWITAIGEGSTYQNIKKAAQNYADFLRYASKEYKTAQANAVNMAERIPKW